MYTVNCNSEWQLYYVQFLPSSASARGKKKKKSFLDLAKKFIAYSVSSDETNSLHQGVSRLLNMFSAQFPSYVWISHLFIFSYLLNVVQKPNLMMQLWMTVQHGRSEAWREGAG